MTTSPSPAFALDRDALKYIAIFAMTLNHIANIFLNPGTWPFELMVGIGYFTAITMIYFLVEGYHYTHSKRRYFERLCIFALISEVPFCLAFTSGGVLSFYGMNMIFTLCLCFGILWVLDHVQHRFGRVVLILLLTFASTFSDWAWLAPFFTMLFAWSWQSRPRTKIAMVLAAGFFALTLGLTYFPAFSFGTALGFTLLNLSGMVAAILCLLYCYNGKKGAGAGKFSKWFFYIYYPAHLLLLGILRLIFLS